jgi:hypothetical protein
MPIVRITLPAEKRAVREKMRALGLIEGIRRITSRQQPLSLPPVHAADPTAETETDR